MEYVIIYFIGFIVGLIISTIGKLFFNCKWDIITVSLIWFITLPLYIGSFFIVVLKID